MPSLFPTGPKVQILSVTELTAAISQSLQSNFPSVWVSGEITNLSRPQSGHLYFSLRDEQAILGAALFRSAAMRMKFDLRDGMHVVVRGRISVYEPQGKYQLLIEEIQPKGIGAQELALRQLKEKLLTKGYFDPRRKRKLPAFPRRIALVTSPSGAAVRDMLQVLTTRWPPCDIFVCPVRVQGEGAAQEIAWALRLLNRLHRDPAHQFDAIVLGRGGGSSEDLWAFNEESVADAIFASLIPIVSAVGHEIDVTIADLVADDRALTPTDAANKVTPDRAELLQTLRSLRDRITDAAGHRLSLARQRLAALSSRAALRLPLERISDRAGRLDELSSRLHRAIKAKIDRSGESLAALASRLETLSPLNVLGRGYTLTRTEASDELVRDASRIQPGDRLLTTLASGEIVSRVEEVRVARS